MKKNNKKSARTALTVSLLFALSWTPIPSTSQTTTTILKDIYLMGFMPMTGKVWPGGRALVPALDMALRHVNARGDVLPGYNLKVIWRDTQCNAGISNNAMFELLYNPPVKHMILGPLCSTEAEVQAESAHYWNISHLFSSMGKRKSRKPGHYCRANAEASPGRFGGLLIGKGDGKDKMFPIDAPLCLIGRLDMISLIGKKGRDVAAILTPEMKRALDILVTSRATVGIDALNRCLFPRSTGDGHIEGHVCLSKLAYDADLKYPERIGSTKLRKYIATVVQMLNLEHGELEWLSNHLGHTIDVHKEFYRNQEGAVQLGKVAKMLIAVDQGRILDNQTDENADGDVSNQNPDEQWLVLDDSSSDDEDDDVSGEASAKKSSESNASLDVPLPKSNYASGRVKVNVKRWTQEEIAALKRQFDYSQLKPPNQASCLNAISNEPALVNRTWKHVKFRVWHEFSFGSASPVLSNRKRFPRFFRVQVPEQRYNLARVALCEHFNWKKIATISSALPLFSAVTDDFVTLLQTTDITIITQEIFENDPTLRVHNLKNKDARIIISGSYEHHGKLILCAAYRVGLYGPKIVWIFPGWYIPYWWRFGLDNVPCTADEMDVAAEGHILTGIYFRNPKDERSIGGITPTEFDELRTREPTYTNETRMFEHPAANVYDSVWACALALNCTNNVLIEQGHAKSLGEFSYADGDIGDVMTSCIYNLSFTGLTGGVSFDQTGEPLKNIKIDQIQGVYNDVSFVGLTGGVLFDQTEEPLKNIKIDQIQDIYSLSFTGVSFDQTVEPLKNIKIDQNQDLEKTNVGTYVMDEGDARFLEWNNGGIRWPGKAVTSYSIVI